MLREHVRTTIPLVTLRDWPGVVAMGRERQNGVALAPPFAMDICAGQTPIVIVRR